MTSAEPATLAYLVRRSASPQWRGFLRALVETLDEHMDAEARDTLLRTVGGRMGALSPLPGCTSLAELEARMNDVLAATDWGYVELAFDPDDHALMLTHSAAPALTTAADPGGTCIAAVLEGLHAAWLAGQPGAEAGLSAQRVATTPAAVVLRYGRG